MDRHPFFLSPLNWKRCHPLGHFVVSCMGGYWSVISGEVPCINLGMRNWRSPFNGPAALCAAVVGPKIDGPFGGRVAQLCDCLFGDLLFLEASCLRCYSHCQIPVCLLGQALIPLCQPVAQRRANVWLVWGAFQRPPAHSTRDKSWLITPIVFQLTECPALTRHVIFKAPLLAQSKAPL